MATYAIGDVQGCFTELQQLLLLIHFNPEKDRLWFTGDLLNRGPQSLATLRFVKNLGDAAVTVLGNHDLHFIAVAADIERLKSKDTFQDVLAAPELEELVTWLRHRPLLHYDASLNYAMVHAGLAPQWSLAEALACAAEVETILRSANYADFLAHMYGDTPDCWRPTLKGWGRLRIITNYFTRMRYVDAEGRLELHYKGPIGGQAPGYFPWFALPNRVSNNLPVIFGHWASLKGQVNIPNVFALDTGCCWGNCLTAFCLESGKCYQINCQQKIQQ